MSSPVANLENFRIPLEEIKSATEEFHEKKKIAGEIKSVYYRLYRGQLSESWENRTATFKRFDNYNNWTRKEFLNELKVISILKHENILPFLGYSDEGEEMIMVYEYAVNGSLADHLKDPDKRNCLTWQQRLEICLDAERVLSYLHSGLGQHGKLIHGDFMDENVFLDDNLKAKICGFEFSEFIPSNQPRQQVYKHREFGGSHMDPIYLETNFLKVESDVYSFGVLLFNILTRPDAFNEPSKHDMPNSLTMAVQHYFDNRLDSVIDPAIRDQIDRPSFRKIEEITCKCLSYNIKDRPTMDTIRKTIEEALLDIQKREAISVEGSHGEYRNPRELRIPFKEIELAMQMSEKSSLPPHVCSDLYTAELSERWPNRTVVFKIYNIVPVYESTDKTVKREMFHNEHNIVSRFHHENIIPYIGYCDEGGSSDRSIHYNTSINGGYADKNDGNSILIYEHAINGSLRDHLQDPDKLRCITWEQRLKICLGAARGIKCLHSGLWEENRLVVHRHVRSENILLDENMEAKISGFGLSIFVPRNKRQVSDNYRNHERRGMISYIDESVDPIYQQSYIVNTEADVYSFGLVMFEILSGSVLKRKCKLFEKPELIRRVHRHYGDNEMDKLIDPNLRDQIDDSSLQTFVETAYKCLSYNIKERPSINRIIRNIEEALHLQKQGAEPSTMTIPSQPYQKLEDLQIPLEEINLATKNFSTEIGKGAFAVVYKGRLSESWTKHEAAFKCLKKISDKEMTEFLKELELISKFHHQNIIPFVGYCDDGDKMILVSEYAINGSLDGHLEKPEKMRLLTWNKRLKICLGAAKGLEYLHSSLGEANKVIHRDVKSGNILLDDNLEAKICDFGLSKSGLTSDHQHSKHYTRVAGTDYYMDPVYYESGILRTVSDVYSFGVVMFEMLSGMPAYRRRRIGGDQPRPLLNLVRRYYDYGKKLLIDPQIKDKDQIDSNSFHTFIEIAYQCISFNSMERPSMETIVDKIEEALDFQEKKEGLKQS